MEQSIIRTVIVYFDNRTSLLASAVMNEIADRHNVAYLMFNLDQPLLVSPTDDNIGGELLNICIYENIVDGTHHRLSSVFFDARYTNVFLSSNSASNDDIIAFFKAMWQNYVLNGMLIFWWQNITIYTHFPYQRVFMVKVLEWDGVGRPIELPRGIAKAILRPKLIYMGNTTIDVYVGSDPPKMHRVPGRYRIGPEFHFGGRDGFVAMLIEQMLHGHWHYRTVLRRFGVVDFVYNMSGLVDDPMDMWNRPMTTVVAESNNSKLTMYNISSNFEQS